MKIHELTLENFHGFEKRHITFSDQFTVLIGDNGSGKTAVLDGLAVALGSFLSGLDGVQSRHIRRDEVHRKTYFHGELADVQLQFPVRITCKGTLDNKLMTWTRAVNGKNGSTTSKEAKPIIDHAALVQKAVSDGKPVIIPVISYYGTGRLWVQKKDSNENRHRNDRLGGYLYCLDPASSEKHFTRWMEKMTYIELQRKSTPPVLEAVRDAVSICMRNWKSIEFDVDTEELKAIDDAGRVLPFRLLSDGVRNMIGMVADIAHRMAQLNPALEKEVVTRTPGVILIDEIDLHLHPIWQRSIVEDLKRTFPNVQFIVITHSPFVIQSLEEGELRRLQAQDDDEEVASDYFINKSIEDIAEQAMGVEGVQRSERLNEMYSVAKEYYSLLKKGQEVSEDELNVIKNELDRLEGLYSSDVAYYAFLEMERTAAGLGRTNQMRPVDKGNVPTDPAGVQISIKNYQQSRGYLIDRLGTYCTYCERYLGNNIAVEHIQPKSSVPELSLDWDNFLSSCNTTEMREQIIDTATSTGFFSIWLKVFENDQDMRVRIINAFPGSSSQSFNSIGVAIQRAGGLI